MSEPSRTAPMGTTVEFPLAPASPRTRTARRSLQSPTRAPRRWPLPHMLLVLGLWMVIFVGSLPTPPLLDDADATHAQAAQAMLQTGDFVTLHVDGIRYLEKAPLPYWICALSLRLFGSNSFAVHLPLALTVLGLALLGYGWSRRAFGSRAALYTALFTLTSAGVFLFTRVFIPDALLSLLLAFILFAMLQALESGHAPDRASLEYEAVQRPQGRRTSALWAYSLWGALALAVLTKGLVALVFFLGTAFVYLIYTGEWHNLRRLRPVRGVLLLLAIAAPWHILAGLRNTGGAGGHGFFWFYFVNEHFLRFLGRRLPRDYNKLPGYLYWSLHLVWLFPWSLFAPAAILYGWRKRRELQSRRDTNAAGERLSRLELLRISASRRGGPALESFAGRTVSLLCIFSALVLCFFSLSTNQEYYTFPVYLPLLMLIAAALAGIERESTAAVAPSRGLRRTLAFGFTTFAVIGVAVTAALAYGLWSARHLPFEPDIGSMLAHRGVGDYTLSMSHFFDLTGPSFAALRLPAALAGLAFALGPGIGWWLFRQRLSRPPRPGQASLLVAPLTAVALTSAVFLTAAHIALVRFAPMLSSQSFAATIQSLERSGRISPRNEVLIFGDQAFGSSIPFYLHRRVDLVDGRTTSMLFGSTFRDAPPIFLTHDQLLAQWGRGPRKLLFVPLEQRDAVDHLLGTRQIVLQETSGKALITDRPIDTPR